MSTQKRQYGSSDGDMLFAKQHYQDLDLRNAPKSIQSVVREALSIIADGDECIVKKEKSILTPNEAAQLLNVSRSFLIKLLDQEEIPYHTLGKSKHRRIFKSDVIEFEKRHKRRAKKSLDELIELSEDMGLYDE